MEQTWRELFASARGYVKPRTYPLRLIANPRARTMFNRACLKIDVGPLPDNPCVYVMRYRGSHILRVGTAIHGLSDRVERGYNRPYQATHPTMTLGSIYEEWEAWAGGAHLTNALVMYGLSRKSRKGDLEVEIHPFRAN